MGIGTLPNGLPYIDHGGHIRVMGALRDKKSRSYLPLFSASVPLIPRSQWKEFDEPDDHLPILDQNGHGSCVGHGSCTAFTQSWSQAGNVPRLFSANYLYSLVNGGSDNGAVVGDAMDALVKDGICLASTVPEGNEIFTRQMPSGAASEASRFRLGQCYRVTSFDEIVTATLLGYGVAIGVNWPANGDTDSDGFLPSPRGSVGGHCLCVRLGLRSRGGQWFVKGQNSWGLQWGIAGKFFMGADWFSGSTDHFVCESPKIDPQDPDVPPSPMP